MGLFKPAWKGENSEKAYRAIQRIKNQDKLSRIARDSSVWDVIRNMAVERLIDQAVLADIAKNNSNSMLRLSAASRLTDQTLAQKTYADVAKNAGYLGQYREAAVRKLTDQTVIADVAKNDKESIVRSAAIEKLTDQIVIADVAKNDKESFVRSAAIKKLTDQAALADIALTAQEWFDRSKAIEKLTDQAMLAKVAKNSSNISDRRSAGEKLTDPSALAELVEKETDDSIRKMLLEKINFQNTGQPDTYVIIETLYRECRWHFDNVENYDILKSEFQRRENEIIRPIGEKLNQAGGIDLMRKVYESVQGCFDRSCRSALEMKWNGIGDWRM